MIGMADNDVLVDGEEQVTKLEFEDLDSHLADFETEVIAYDR